MKRSARFLTAIMLAGAATVSLTACLPEFDGGSLSGPSSRDQIVADIQQALEDSGEFDGVEVSKGNLTVGWDLDVAVTTDEPLTSDQLDLMLRTAGERISGTNISSVTFLHTPPGTVLGDNIHVAARGLDLVDQLERNGAALVLSRNEVINYAKAQATEG
ncbi:hypothetical protein [Microbacterium gorillae]|uniref:hypothetical protein n=1 Tax=Microbacterium gorillae TaxID=1231063 RepID=UPI003D97DAF9